MIQHEYTQVNGIRLHYATAGSGPLLLFLHSFLDFWYLWNDQIALVTEHIQRFINGA